MAQHTARRADVTAGRHVVVAARWKRDPVRCPGGSKIRPHVATRQFASTREPRVDQMAHRISILFDMQDRRCIACSGAFGVGTA
jgi:hypothetical protein